MALLHRPALPFPRRFGTPFGQIRSGRLLFALATMLLVAAALLQVNQFSRLTSTSYQINGLNRERAAKQAANHEIEAEVAHLSSLARVDIEARVRLGMVPADRKLYITVNQPAPIRESLPTRFLPQERQTPATPAPSSDEPLWKRTLKLLPFF